MAVTTTSSARDMKQGNSNNHDEDGQNILFGDGHVSFEQNPFVGVQRDNIFTTKTGSTAFTGGPVQQSPFDGNDSILLPVD
jgi:prepilin-type processing-associated H-X9-DG protein